MRMVCLTEKGKKVLENLHNNESTLYIIKIIPKSIQKMVIKFYETIVKS
jgi:hypothetical protein